MHRPGLPQLSVGIRPGRLAPISPRLVLTQFGCDSRTQLGCPFALEHRVLSGHCRYAPTLHRPARGPTVRVVGELIPSRKDDPVIENVPLPPVDRDRIPGLHGPMPQRQLANCNNVSE